VQRIREIMDPHFSHSRQGPPSEQGLPGQQEPDGTPGKEGSLESILAECLERLEADGEAGVEAVLRRHPARAEEVHGWLEAYRGWGLAPGGGGEEDRSFPERLGEFRLLKRLGRGGMGVVYLAEQEPLGRVVALKLIRPEQLYFPGARERFQREVEAIAKLQHPGIVPIFTVGEERGIPYFAMERVHGASLAAVLTSLQGSNPEKLTARDMANAIERALEPRTGEASVPQHSPAFQGTWVDATYRLAHQVAEALAHAHGRGVLHRDVKPSNIMITPDGRALLLDFGLAHTEGAGQLTRTGSLLGSLPYMPPEMLRGDARTVDQRGDIYSLAVVLYEVLTLRVPYFAECTETTRQRIVLGQPETVRARNRSVPWDAETICLSAMEADSGRRYATAAALARDLESFLARRPIEARRPGPLLRVRRWTQRRPAASVAIAAGILLAIGAAAFGLSQAAANRRTEGLRFIAESANALRSDPGLAVLLALEGAERAPGLRANNALTAAIHACKEEHTLRGGGGGVRAITWSPDGRWIAAGANDLKARIWNASTGELHAILEGHSGGIRSAAFDGEVTRLLTASADGTARLWSLDGKAVRVFTGHSGGLNMAELSPDGRRVLTAAEEGDGTVRVWDSASGEKLFVLAGHRTDRYVTASYSPDGVRIATGSYDKTACLWEAATGRLLHRFGPLEGPGWAGIRTVAFSPDGRRLAAASLNGSTYVWDAVEGTLLRELKGHEREVLSVRFNHDGRRLVTAAYDNDARVWSLDSGDFLPLRGHAGKIFSAVFSCDGRNVLTVSEDSTARVWDAETGKQREVLLGHEEPVNGGCFSPDGARVATASHATSRVWSIAGEERSIDLVSHREVVASVAFSAGGAFVATASLDHAACLWDARTGARLATLEGHEAGVLGVSFSDDESRVLTISRDLTARVWDARTGQPLARLKGHKLWLKAAAFSPAGRHAVTVSADSARAWDAASGAEIAAFLEDSKYELTAAAYRPDGECIALASTSGAIRVWRPDRREVTVLEGRKGGPLDGVSSVEWSSCGRRILGASDNATAMVWDAASSQVVLVLNGHTQPVRFASYSHAPASARILTASDDATARIWDAESGRELMVLRGHKRGLVSAAFSRDDRLVLTVGRDMTARLWDASTGEAIAVLGEDGRGISSAAFSRSSTRMITGLSDGLARILDVVTDPLETARRRRPRELTAEERERFGLER